MDLRFYVADDEKVYVRAAWTVERKVSPFL